MSRALQKGFNKAYGLATQGWTIFDGLHDKFSDIDGVSNHDKYKIIISEKFRWYDIERDTIHERLDLEYDKRPVLFLCTQNPKDISKLPYEEKLIYINESKVVKVYDNTNEAFGAWVKENNLGFYFPYQAMRNKSVNEIIDLWLRYIDTIDN